MSSRARLVVRFVRAVLALVTLLFVTPGALELVEDVAHYLEHGDTLHDEGHEADHCCSGAFHFCGCHARTVAAPSETRWLAVLVSPNWVANRTAHAARPTLGGPSDAHLRELLRPPTA